MPVKENVLSDKTAHESLGKQPYEKWENRDIWLIRKNGLINYATGLSDNLDKSGLHPKDKDALKEFLKRYIIFLHCHFNYFYYETFVGDDPTEKYDPEYPPDHVMRVTINQAAIDLDVIEQVIAQRQSGSDKGKETLKIADFLASEALKPAYHLFKESPVVFTYFQKSPSIRLIPYAPVALIAIPPTSIEARRDLLAIPHEVGHYVYWNGEGVRKESFVDTTDNNPLLANVQNIIDAEEDDKKLILESAFFNWQEEIFADVYGSLIAGPLIALDFQDLQLDLNKEDFEEGDGDHPLPVIRPYIYRAALKSDRSKIPDKEHWQNILEARWINKLYKRQIYDTKTFSLGIRPKKFLLIAFKNAKKGGIELKNVTKRLERRDHDEPPHVRTVLEDKAKDVIKNMQVQGLKEDIDPSPTWWGDFLRGLDVSSYSEDNLEELYKDFNTKVKGINREDKENVNREISKVPGYDDPNNIDCKNTFYEKLKNKWEKDWKQVNPKWLRVFKAAGWTVEGPTKEYAN